MADKVINLPDRVVLGNDIHFPAYGSDSIILQVSVDLENLGLRQLSWKSMKGWVCNSFVSML